MFLARNTGRLCGIGPAPHNLKTKIFPLEIFVGKKPVEFFITKVEKLIFLESKKPIVAASGIINLTLKFKTFECALELNNDEGGEWLGDNENNQLTLTTLQKDNPVVWIEDWILWHCRLYGVRRIVLYDNGSHNQKELVRKLRKLEPEVQVILVYWEFPFGLYPYFYAQRGSLNHCRIRFNPAEKEDSSRNWYCINLDIDEYLVSPHRKNFFEYLQSKLNSSQLFAVVVKEFRVPNILPAQCYLYGTLRFFNFRYRYRNSNGAVDSQANIRNLVQHKYIYRFGSPLYNDTHRVSPNSHGLKISEKILFYLQRFPTKFSRHFWRVKRYLNISPIESTKPQYHSVFASESDFYYLHFIGLACKWNDRSKIGADIYSEDWHIESEIICDLARQAKLTNS